MTPTRFSLFLVVTLLTLTVTFPAGVLAQTSTPATSQSPEDCVETEEGDGCLSLAPSSARIDLVLPSFSNPTNITNPLFPISNLQQAVLLGSEDFQDLRVETTLLPETKTVAWDGNDIETAVSQFVAYRGDHIVEVALDYYAQADDGSVWYFGEDVANYEDGEIVDTEGTWLAGKDGPPGMIMPANPKVGDVYRPENIPGFVFEEVTILATGLTVNAPQGHVEGAILIEEHLMDDTFEYKMFAPSYGEFAAETPTEYLFMALAVPADSQSGTVPAELEALSTDIPVLRDAISSADWDAASDLSSNVTATWDAYVETATDVSPVLEVRMSDYVSSLEHAVDAENAEGAHDAAFGILQTTLDLELQYRTPADIDLKRMDLWTDQLIADAAVGDAGSILNDIAALEAIWGRVSPTVDQPSADTIGGDVKALRSAAESEDTATLADAVAQLRSHLDDVQSAS